MSNLTLFVFNFLEFPFLYHLLPSSRRRYLALQGIIQHHLSMDLLLNLQEHGMLGYVILELIHREDVGEVHEEDDVMEDITKKTTRMRLVK